MRHVLYVDTTSSRMRDSSYTAKASVSDQVARKLLPSASSCCGSWLGRVLLAIRDVATGVLLRVCYCVLTRLTRVHEALKIPKQN